MGQKLGKAEFIEEARPFLNLPSDSVRKLWDAFNDVAEGFGLNSDEFKTICEAAKLHEFLATSRTELDAAVDRIFIAFDTDEVRACALRFARGQSALQTLSHALAATRAHRAVARDALTAPPPPPPPLLSHANAERSRRCARVSCHLLTRQRDEPR
tara:strand:+ start:155 stop:622 length:468 start_codon:yes stop_codon:yes gene_type:complete